MVIFKMVSLFKQDKETQDKAKAHIMGILAPLVEEAVNKRLDKIESEIDSIKAKIDSKN